MRKILYVPILHNQADLGSLKEKLSEEGERKYGKTAWESHLIQVEEAWNRVEHCIRQYIDTNKIPATQIRIYQDGLPATGNMALAIVRDVARQGSRNYQILEDLIDRGACIEQAESPELLRQEYEFLSRIKEATTPTERLIQYILYQEGVGQK